MTSVVHECQTEIPCMVLPFWNAANAASWGRSEQKATRHVRMMTCRLMVVVEVFTKDAVAWLAEVKNTTCTEGRGATSWIVVGE